MYSVVPAERASARAGTHTPQPIDNPVDYWVPACAGTTEQC